MRGLRQLAEVREVGVVRDTEAASVNGLPFPARRVSQAEAGCEVGFLRSRLAKRQHTGHAGDRIQALQFVACRNALELVPNADVKGQVPLQFDRVGHVSVELEVVAVIDTAPGVALGLNVGIEVQEVSFQSGVVVVATLALDVKVRGRVPAEVGTELDRVHSAQEAEVGDSLIGALVAALRRVVVRADLDVKVLLDRDVGERVQTRELEVPRGHVRHRAAEPEAAFVEPPRGERPEIRHCHEFLCGGGLGDEHRQIRR